MTLRPTTFRFIEELTKKFKSVATPTNFAQGSTVIDSQSIIDNLENEASPTSNPAPGALDLYFNIPEDVVRINSVKLSYRLQAPKVWTSVTETAAPTSSSSAAPLDDISRIFTAIVNGGNPEDITDLAPDPTGTHSRIYFSFVYQNKSGSARTVNVQIIDVTDSNTVIGQTGNGSVNDDSLAGALAISSTDRRGNTIKFRVGGTDGAADGDVVHIFMWAEIEHTHTVSHSHNVDYDLSTETFGATDIRIFTTDDASASPTWSERTSAIESEIGTLASSENSTESDIDLTEWFSGTGWKGIRIVANGDSRCYAGVTYKCFVESKVV